MPAPLNLGSASLLTSSGMSLPPPAPEPPNSASSSHFSGSGTEYSPYSPDFGPRSQPQSQVFALPMDDFRPSPPSYGRAPGSGGDYGRTYGHARSATAQSLDSLMGGGLGGSSSGVAGGIRMTLPSAGAAPLTVGSAPVRSHMQSQSQYPAQGFSEGSIGTGVGGAPRGSYFPGRSGSTASTSAAYTESGASGYRSADEYVTGSRGASAAEYTTADLYHGTAGTFGREFEQQHQHQRDYSGSSGGGRVISPLPRSPTGAYRPASSRPTSPSGHHRRPGSPSPLPRINSPPPPPEPVPVPRIRRREDQSSDAPPPAAKKRRDRRAGS